MLFGIEKDRYSLCVCGSQKGLRTCFGYGTVESYRERNKGSASFEDRFNQSKTYTLEELSILHWVDYSIHVLSRLVNLSPNADTAGGSLPIFTDLKEQ